MDYDSSRLIPSPPRYAPEQTAVYARLRRAGWTITRAARAAGINTADARRAEAETEAEFGPEPT